MSATAQAAVDYARMRIAVFPLMVRDKKPLPYSTGLFAASDDPALASLRWAGGIGLPIREPKDGEDPGKLPRRVLARPECNVACATGPASGVWVLDLDGPVAEQGLADLVAVHGELPATPEQVTGGGRQIFFAWDPAAPIHNSAGKIGKDIDVRGDGGYVVLPPSVHPGNPKKGIPPGRIYTWAPGRSPEALPFAAAPAWLVKLALPAEAPPRPAPKPVKARAPDDTGWATRYGAAALTAVCRDLAAAPDGRKNNTIFTAAARIGALVAGGEIHDRAYALGQLEAAGQQMVARWTKREADTLQRGFETGEGDPKTAPERRNFEPVAGRAPAASKPTAAEISGDIRDVRSLWSAARPADCKMVRGWFRRRGLDVEALPGALGRMRAHARAPLADLVTGPALLIPLFDDPGDLGSVQALIAVPLVAEMRLLRFMGPRERRVAMLTAWPSDGELLVAMHFDDAWALGGNAHGNGHPIGVVFAPSVAAFAGEALGDRYGRVDPAMPFADPEHPPWTCEGERAVSLAVRGDLRTPELRSRMTYGGTERTRLEGDAAARFYGGLAQQAWRAAGANPVRILRPSGGRAGFHSQSREAA